MKKNKIYIFADIKIELNCSENNPGAIYSNCFNLGILHFTHRPRRISNQRDFIHAIIMSTDMCGCNENKEIIKKGNNFKKRDEQRRNK